MGREKWNVLTALAVAVTAAGVLWVRMGGGMPARVLTAAGAVAAGAVLVAMSRSDRRHPVRCPACGGTVKPQGQWLPGTGYVGVRTCPHCGAPLPVSIWEQEP